jgi:hypothetical protein
MVEEDRPDARAAWCCKLRCWRELLCEDVINPGGWVSMGIMMPTPVAAAAAAEAEAEAAAECDERIMANLALRSKLVLRINGTGSPSSMPIKALDTAAEAEVGKVSEASSEANKLDARDGVEMAVGFAIPVAYKLEEKVGGWVKANA